MTSSTSVCMATYNGARWVEQQVSSIRAQLAPGDQLVIVDDCSTDDTVRVLRAIDDERITVLESPVNMGYVAAFESALSRATGDYVFLADQDDVWPPGRVELMRTALESGAVVVGNVAVLDGPDHLRGPFGERDWRVSSRTSRRTLRNLLRLAASDMPYFGSAMAVRREVLDLALPFPSSVRELHDAWLALLGLWCGSMVHLDERVVLRRVHGENASGTIRSPLRVARGRAYFAGMCAASWYRVRIARRSTSKLLRSSALG